MAARIHGKLDWAAAAIISLAAVVLHLTFVIHAGGLWRDEVNLINLAKLSSLNEMARDSFPVFMPLVVKGWSIVGLGSADFGLRLLGMLMGIALLDALWIAAWVTRHKPPLLGLAFLALNPVVIFYGDSLRAYGLGCALILLVLAAAWALLNKPSLPRALLFALATVLSVQTLFHNAVLVGAVAVGAWAVSARRKHWRSAAWILAGSVAAAVSLLPYAPVLMSMPDAAAGLRTGVHTATALPSLLELTSFPLQKYTWVWAALLFIAISGGIVAAIRRGRSDPEQPTVSDGDLRIFAATTLVTALGGYAGFLWLAGISPQPWYFLPLMALTVGCLDCGIAPQLPVLRSALVGFAFGTALIAFPIVRVRAMCRFTNVDILAQRLNREASTNDLIVVTPWYCGISFQRYIKPGVDWITLPPLEDHRFCRLDLVRDSLERRDAIRPALDKIVAALQSGHSVWIIGWMELPSPGTPVPPDLPLPPLKDTGWSDTPYTQNWTAQTAGLLAEHTTQCDVIAVPVEEDVDQLENLRLIKASGWR